MEPNITEAKPEAKKIAPLAMLLLGLVIGFLLGRYSVGWPFASGGDSQQLQHLREQVAEAKKLYPAPMGDMRSISGKITAVNGSRITLNRMSANPFDDSPKTRTVIVGPDTKIIRLVPTDPKVLQQEEAAVREQQSGLIYKGTSTAFATPFPLPMPLTEQTISRGELHAGDTIIVYAAANIRNSTSFTATRIQLTIATARIPASAMPK